MVSSKFLLFGSLASCVLAQNVTDVVVEAVTDPTDVAVVAGSANDTDSAVADCPVGFTQYFNSVSLSIPAPPKDVWNLIGDFGNLTWAGGPDSILVNGSGSDNVAGVQRYSVQSGLIFTETLLSYKPFDSSSGTAQEIHSVAPFSVAPYINTTISAPSDGLAISPLCGGAATKVVSAVYYCAQDSFHDSVDSLFTKAHMMTLLAAQSALQAPTFTSCDALTGTNATANGDSTASIPSNTALPQSSAGEKGLSVVPSVLLLASSFAVMLFL